MYENDDRPVKDIQEHCDQTCVDDSLDPLGPRRLQPAVTP